MYRKLFIPALSLMLLAISCKDDGTEEEQPTYTSITLQADKETIEADGTEQVVFTVLADDKEVITTGVTITSGDITVTDGKFSTTTEGTFVFTATYENLRSNTVTVVAETTPPPSPLEISVDRIDVTSDGVDQVTITVEHEGENVSANAIIKGDHKGEVTLSGDKYIFTTTEPGEHDLYADYSDLSSATVRLYAVPEDPQFYRMVGSFRSTGIWCGPCTVYAEDLRQAQEDYPDRLAVVALHGSTPERDPMTPDNFRSVLEGLVYGSASFPTHNFEFRQRFTVTGGSTPEGIVRNIKSIIDQFPATTGFLVQSGHNGTTANVKITVRATEEDSYYLGVILIEDGLMYPQENYPGMYTHNNTFRSIETPYGGVALNTIEANKSVTTEFTIDLSKTSMNSNCRLMIYSLHDDPQGNRVVNNSTYATLNGVTAFRFEE